jgi:cytochrome c oxidase subunit 2
VSAPRGRRRPARLIAPAALLAVLGTACADTKQNVLEPEGPVARKLDNLWDPVFFIAGIFFFLVLFLVLFVAIRYREKDPDAVPKQLHGNTFLELGWTALPALIMLGVGIFTVATIFDINERPKGDDVVPVTVIGHQWWWEYRYPDHDVVTANELHIPINRKIDVRLESEDVIHSWWPPKLAGKVDVIPGRVNHMTIEAEEPGTYYGQCTEYCGLSHANMRLRVYAHTDEDFDAWVESQRASAGEPAEGSLAAEGKRIFRTKGCAGCHTVAGYAAGEVGPDLTHFASRDTFAGAIFDRNDLNLRRWLRDPPGEKPMAPDDGLGMPNLHLTDQEIDQLIAYLNLLK